MRKFIDGFSINTLVLIAYLALSSCGDSNDTFPESEQPLPVQLCISLADNGYTSDGELIPMNTRAEEKSFFVTRIVFHALFILKKEKDNWIVVDKKSDVIERPSVSYNLFGNKELLTLTDSGRNLVLLPGDYRFLLYLNGIPDMKIGQKIPMNSVETVNFVNPLPSDFYFAKDDVQISKRESLEKKSENIIKLDLKRNSTFIRFILENDDWGDVVIPTVTYQLFGTICIGLDVNGDPVIGRWEDVVSDNNLPIDIKTIRTEGYMINGKKCFFSSVELPNTNLSLFADDEERAIKLNITKIGNRFESIFKGSHEVSIPILKNHITTILIRKHPTEPDAIQTEVNPKFEWNNFPPLPYIELNN